MHLVKIIFVSTLRPGSEYLKRESDPGMLQRLMLHYIALSSFDYNNLDLYVSAYIRLQFIFL